MPADPYGAAEIGPTPGRRAGLGEQRVVRQERREVLADADRPDARSAAAVRDAERLVQVEVRDVRAEPAGLGEADQRVEVRAVDVDLAAGVVHRRADVADRLLVDTVRRRVGDHDRGELVAVLVDLGVQIVEIDVARPRRSSRRPRACPAITALAAFVPCADAGIRQTVRPVSPRLSW